MDSVDPVLLREEPCLLLAVAVVVALLFAVQLVYNGLVELGKSEELSLEVMVVSLKKEASDYFTETDEGCNSRDDCMPLVFIGAQCSQEVLDLLIIWEEDIPSLSMGSRPIGVLNSLSIIASW
ncbi:hypothetical protein PNOK_0530500 [Pyrrhoderma noxium]|uniref:Uncharacterized protein n=1 Tax=Pyrrhoderma noxium TaxID=2282107 RepID=A0A286UFU0_9AGAM|nr:hypothetical protein PNOK_0530500 [Pyrrhoderma noxium]